jgi:hypothetical protein
MKIKRITAIISIACLILAPQALLAQGYGGEGQATEQSVPSVSDGDLEKAAKAYVGVMQTQQKYQAQLQGETDPAAAQATQEKANSKIETLIREAGLTMDKYNRTMQVVQMHEPTQQKFLAMVSKHQQ